MHYKHPLIITPNVDAIPTEHEPYGTPFHTFLMLTHQNNEDKNVPQIYF
jgi:hypothetical protein